MPNILMKIALFGGRFDPPHNGHLHIAREILKHISDIDEVWFVPANTHPWRPIVVSAQDRLAMTKLLEEKNIKTSDIDIVRGGDTYTIDTINHLLKTTQNSYVFICGADQLKSFSEWKDYSTLKEKLHFVVFPRIGYTISEPLPKNVTLMQATDFIATEDSSTHIRDNIKKGLPITDLVPEKVAAYIKEKKLYQ